MFGGDFQGKNLRRGVRMSDYRVTIGNGECNISSLSDNTLNCRPPYVEPEMSADNKCGYLYKTILVRDIFADCISAWQIMLHIFVRGSERTDLNSFRSVISKQLTCVISNSPLVSPTLFHRKCRLVIRLEAVLRPNIGNTLWCISTVFTRSAITPPKVNRFE